jgi:hypothetical protein
MLGLRLTLEGGPGASARNRKVGTPSFCHCAKVSARSVRTLSDPDWTRRTVLTPTWSAFSNRGTGLSTQGRNVGFLSKIEMSGYMPAAKVFYVARPHGPCRSGGL